MWITGLPGSGKAVLIKQCDADDRVCDGISRARPARAFDTAGELAQYHRARLVVLHILPLPSPFCEPEPSASSVELQARARAAAERRLDTAGRKSQARSWP